MSPTSDRQISPDSSWSTYESNVQAYRQLGLQAQSLYLAVGAILLTFGYGIPFFAVFALAMLSAWYIYFPAIFARTAIVDFHKYQLAKDFTRSGHVFADSDTGEEALFERDYARVGDGQIRRTVYAQWDSDFYE